MSSPPHERTAEALEDTLAADGLQAPAMVDDADGQLRKLAIKAALLDDPGLGATIGRYRVERALGRGGMGVVYAARDSALDRTVAIKLLRRDPGIEDSTERRRLIREAQALARLKHPGVATVHEVAVHEERVYLAMELVDGRTLDRWLEERPRTWREIVETFVQAAEGLIAAHAAGIVHRDFKPTNVMVDDQGRAVVLDFGLARPLELSSGEDHCEAIDRLVAAPSEGLDPSGDLTMTGTLVGTPAYMSPEQFLGVAVTEASDQFSFCVALFEALYGRRPFLGDSVATLARAVTLGPSPSTTGRVPGRVRRAVLRGLSRPPEQRWPTMGALVDQLRASLRPPRYGLVAAGLGAAVLGLGGLAWQAQRGEAEAEAQVVTQEQQTRDARRVQVAQALTPTDPTTAVALLREVEHPDDALGWTDATLAALREPTCRVVLRGHDAQWGWTLQPSPDGRHVLTGSTDGTARLWRADTTGEPWVARDADKLAAAFSPDGTMIATVGAMAQVWRWDGVGEPDSPVAFPTVPELLGSGTTPGIAFSPDGARLATGSYSNATYLWPIPEPGADAQPPRVLTGHEGAVWTVDFSADGRRLLTGSLDGTARIWELDRPSAAPLVLHHDDTVWVARFDASGEHVLTASKDESASLWSSRDGGLQASWPHPTPLLAAAFSPDGTLAATGDGHGVVRLFSVEDPERAAVELRGHEGTINGLTFSAEGRRLLSTSQDGSARLWTLAADGHATKSPVVFAVGEPLIQARFTPDGEQVIVSSDQGVTRLCDAGWTPTETRLSVPGPVRALAAHPDGDLAVVGTTRGVVHLDPAGATSATPEEEHAPVTYQAVALAPDGSWAAAAEPDGSVRLWQPRGSGLHVAEATLEHVWAIGVASGGSHVAVGDGSGALVVWARGPAGLTVQARLRTGDAMVRAITWLDESTMVVGDQDGRLLWWTVGEPELQLVDSGRDAVTQIVASSDPGQFATLHNDGSVRRWRPGPAGLPVLDRQLTCPGDLLIAIAFVEGGQRLMGVSRHGGVHDWPDLSSTRCHPRATLLTDGVVARAVLVDGGRTVLTAETEQDSVRRWHVDAYDVTPHRLRRRLWTATRDCLSVPLRMELLGDDQATAEADLRRCRERAAG